MGFGLGPLGGIVGGISNVVGNAVGKVAGGVGDVLGGHHRGGGSAVDSPAPTDNSIAMMYASDNNKTVALAQIQAQEFALQQASADRQLQVAASVELGLERLDTRLQTSQLDFRQGMVAEENRHEEKMAEYQNVTASHANYDGLPAPIWEGEGVL